jgi:hypothetical protein
MRKSNPLTKSRNAHLKQQRWLTASWTWASKMRCDTSTVGLYKLNPVDPELESA